MSSGYHMDGPWNPQNQTPRVQQVECRDRIVNDGGVAHLCNVVLPVAQIALISLDVY
jgi:hypothetical protein